MIQNVKTGGWFGIEIAKVKPKRKREKINKFLGLSVPFIMLLCETFVLLYWINKGKDECGGNWYASPYSI